MAECPPDSSCSAAREADSNVQAAYEETSAGDRATPLTTT